MFLTFLFVFLLAGLLSESARKNDWNHRKLYNVFENFYRFGSFVFGGGDVLLPMMLDQYVERPDNTKIIKPRVSNPSKFAPAPKHAPNKPHIQMLAAVVSP